MMVHQGFISFSKRSSRFFSEKFKYSSSCNPECNSFYLISWGGVMSFLTIWVRVSWFTCCQEWDILNPSISSLELSGVIFHLKLFLRINAINGDNIWSKFFIYPPGEIIFSSPCLYQCNLFFSLVAKFHLKFRDVFYKPTTSLLFSLLVFHQLRSSIFCNGALSRSCFPSFIPFHSFFCSGGIVMLLSSTHLLVLSRSCSFYDCPFNRSIVPSCQVLSSYQVLLLFSTGVLSEFVLPCSYFLTECSQLCSSLLFFFLSSYSTFPGSLVSLICQRSNLFYLFSYLFRCPSGAILDLGTRSSRSGGVL